MYTYTHVYICVYTHTQIPVALPREANERLLALTSEIRLSLQHPAPAVASDCALSPPLPSAPLIYSCNIVTFSFATV